MRKNLNKLATLALSGMMVMSMAVPAFADPGTATQQPKQTFDNPVVKKVVYTDGNTYAPNTTFSFNVKWKNDTSFKADATNTVTLSEPTDKTDNVAVTVTPIKFSPYLQGMDTVKGTYEAEGKINVDVTKFPGVGYYLFELKEVQGNYEGINYNNNTYKLLVVIYKDEADNGKLKSKVAVYRDGETGETCSKSEYIGNNYGKEQPNPNPNPDPKKPPYDPDPNDEDIHDVTIKKVVKGSMQQGGSFKFTIKVTGDDGKSGENQGGQKFKVVKEDGSEDFVEAGVGKTFTVTDGGNGVRISGLSNSDKITVQETEATGYTMLVKTETPSKIAGNTAPGAKNVTADDLDVTADDYTTPWFTAKKNEAKVTVTNKKDQIPLTGVVMNVAPYAMMLAVAGGLGVVFVNRKKEEE